MANKEHLELIQYGRRRGDYKSCRNSMAIAFNPCIYSLVCGVWVNAWILIQLDQNQLSHFHKRFLERTRLQLERIFEFSHIYPFVSPRHYCNSLFPWLVSRINHKTQVAIYARVSTKDKQDVENQHFCCIFISDKFNYRDFVFSHTIDYVN